MAEDTFDENDTSSWFYGGISNDEVLELLQNEEPGTFLVRDSKTKKDTYVICLKETNEVCNYQVRTSEQNGQTQYKIRDDFSFSDIPSLLSFYKRNLFKTTCLKRPVGSVVTRGHTSGKQPQRYSENITSLRTKAGLSRQVRMSAPAEMRMRNSRDDNSPLYMKVTKPRTPSAYFQDQLSLKVGDVIKVTRRSGDNWEGELNGKIGTFPLSCVEFTESPPEEQE